MRRTMIILAGVLMALTAMPRATSAVDHTDDIIYASYSCRGDGTVAVSISWDVIYTDAVELGIDLGYWEAFDLGHYRTEWLANSQATHLLWDNLLADQVHFIRIERIFADGERLYSRPDFFQTPKCRPSRIASSPTSSTSNSGGSASDPSSYIGSSAPPGDFCNYVDCTEDFNNSLGTVVQCTDGTYSKSGGRQGACSQHQGVARTSSPAGNSSVSNQSDRAGCHPSYPTICVPLGPPLIPCSDVPQRNFPVFLPDSHGFDPDRNGLGCESN